MKLDKWDIIWIGAIIIVVVGTQFLAPSPFPKGTVIRMEPLHVCLTDNQSVQWCQDAKAALQANVERIKNKTCGLDSWHNWTWNESHIIRQRFGTGESGECVITEIAAWFNSGENRTHGNLTYTMFDEVVAWDGSPAVRPLTPEEMREEG